MASKKKITTKKPLFGNRRSHALNATKMHQNPNLQTFTINGEKVKLKGVNRHDFNCKTAATVTVANLVEDINVIILPC